MKQDYEFQRAILRKRNEISRSLARQGFFAVAIRFIGNGGVEITARKSADTDRALFEAMDRELADMDAAILNRSRNEKAAEFRRAEDRASPAGDDQEG